MNRHINRTKSISQIVNIAIQKYKRYGHYTDLSPTIIAECKMCDMYPSTSFPPMIRISTTYGEWQRPGITENSGSEPRDFPGAHYCERPHRRSSVLYIYCMYQKKKEVRKKKEERKEKKEGRGEKKEIKKGRVNLEFLTE